MLDNLKAQWNQSAVMRWYAGREPNEQPIIAGVAALVALSILWLGVWKPISDWRDLETNRFQNAQSLWDFVQANEQTARQTASSQARGSTQTRSLLPLITREANSLGLTLSRLQPEADGAISVVLQAQSFNAMLTWLDALTRKHSVAVMRVSMDAEGNPGLINAQLRLQ